MSRKSPLTPLFQRGEQTTRVFSDRIVENYFFGVAMVTSPFEKGGKRGICGRYNVAAKAVLSFLLICFIAVSTVSAQTPRKIIIGVSNPDNVTFFPLYLAKDAGYFREQGLEPQMIVMNSDLAVKALVTGDVDYAASTASMAKAAALGFPVKIIVSFFNGTDFSLVSKTEIKTPADLKNKIVAV